MKLISRIGLPQHAQQGIALIECLIAMLIFSFGVLGLVGLEARAINFSVDAEDRNRAALFAQEIASQMWINGNVDRNSFATAAEKATYDAVITAGKASLYNATVLVTIVPPPPASFATVNSATIKITWHPPQDKATDPDSVLTTQVVLP